MDQSQGSNVDEPRPDTPDEQPAAPSDAEPLDAAIEEPVTEPEPAEPEPEPAEPEPEPAEPEPATAAAEPIDDGIEQAEAEPEVTEPDADPVAEGAAEGSQAESVDDERAVEPVAEEEEAEPEAAAPPEPEPLAPEAELIAAVEEAFEDVDVAAAEAEAESEAEAPAVVDEWQPGDWFVVHTYAGYENKVKANLETRIVSMNMEEKIFEVVIPMEDVMEMKGGKKQMVQRKVFPGYLLVRMDLDDDSWYVVRNTPGVTGFVGSGNKPIPLSTNEVDRILQRGAAAEEERPRPKPEWQVNDPVRVTTGPFANFQGVVSEVDLDRSKLKVLVNIFGRETPVELGFDQVAKV